MFWCIGLKAFHRREDGATALSMLLPALRKMPDSGCRKRGGSGQRVDQSTDKGRTPAARSSSKQNDHSLAKDEKDQEWYITLPVVRPDFISHMCCQASGRGTTRNQPQSQLASPQQLVEATNACEDVVVVRVALQDFGSLYNLLSTQW